MAAKASQGRGIPRIFASTQPAARTLALQTVAERPGLTAGKRYRAGIQLAAARRAATDLGRKRK